MIELQRQKLGLPPAGTSAEKQPSPSEVARDTLLSEDAQIERFINLLQRRDRKTTNAHHHHHHHHHHSDLMPSSNGPTVPTALSRRMLQRQGVGYLDDTVASVVSASADRFLATVLQQSIACRDQRLKGAAMTREAAKQRKQHMEYYEADNADRKRRREAITKAREDVAVLTIANADAIKKGGSGIGTDTGGATKKKSKKGTKKNPAAAAKATGPGKADAALEALATEELEEEYDSIDEEEEYYQENVVEVTRERIVLKKTGDNEDQEDDDEDSDDEDDTLLLRDIVRPLEAWNFHLNGKEAIETDDDNDEIEDNDKDLQESGNSKTDPSNISSTTQQAQQTDEKAKNDNETSNASANGTEESKQQSSEKKQGEPAPNGNKNGAAKKQTAPSLASSPTKMSPAPSSS